MGSQQYYFGNCNRSSSEEKPHASRQVKWSRQTKSLAQALMQKKKVLDVEPKKKVFVSTVVKKVTLLKVKIAQPEVASVASVVNMVIMLAVGKGEET